MAATKRAWYVDYLVYLIVRGLVAFLQMLRPQTAYAVADGLAGLAFTLNRRHREVALANLRIAFPEKDEAWRLRTVRRTYGHFARMVAEIALIPRKMHVSNWKNRLRILMTPAAAAAMMSRRPRMILTGHLGNWEMSGYFMGAVGIKSFAIARDLDNPYLHDYLNRFREFTGQTIVSKNGDWERIAGALKSGGLLVSLADQSAGQRGLFVDFFGKPASTHKATALMAIQYDALIVAGYTLRDRDVPGQPFQYVMYSYGVIDPRDYAHLPDPVAAITRAYLRVLEDGIRMAPEQYLWLHNRWKHTPPASKKAKARQAA